MRIPRMKSPPVTLRSITSPPGFHGHTLDPEVCARWKITAPVQASPRGVPRAIAGKSHCGLNVQRIVDGVVHLPEEPYDAGELDDLGRRQVARQPVELDIASEFRYREAPLPEGGNKVDVKFTLTAPGCGMGEVLKTDMESKILSLTDVKDVDVEVVFDPPWDQSMMSDAVKLQLGFM